VRIERGWFKDEDGRTRILRGVNLGGSSKVPFIPRGATHVREGFFQHRDVSFVGRPFPIGEADEHFARLRAWGLTFLRLLVTWEAMEHRGPGEYDEAYLDYVYEVVRKAGEHGLELFIDPHQDVWSRMSGGDGAPGWTFEAIGMDVTRFAATGAAIVHATHGDPFPRMIWPTNYSKLAAATMFTLFFGGNDFAPRTKVDGEPVQDYLQRRYIGAMVQIASRLRGLAHVVGYDTMNEPDPGFIGWPDLNAHGGLLRLGESPTPLQAMALGAGIPQEVAIYSMGLVGARARGNRIVNAGQNRVWAEDRDCIWREHGVWDVDAEGNPRLLQPDYFARARGRTVDFANDYLAPFWRRYARAIGGVDPDAILFVEGTPRQPPPSLGLGMMRPDGDGLGAGVVYAGHWYDGLTLFTKRYMPLLGVDFESGKPVFGRRRVQRSFASQLARIKSHAVEKMGGIPTIIGEFGIPFDMNDRRAYRTSDFSQQEQALDRSFRALDANLLSGTLWNYTADNDNQWGDQWNGEDLSIFSRDQQSDPRDIDSGGRGLRAAVRPLACRTAGEPLEMRFDYKTGAFEFSFRHDPGVKAPTELFVPNLQYPNGYDVEVSDGTYETDRSSQRMLYRHSFGQDLHYVTLRRRKRC
jgi:hypothetical protein